MKVTRILPFQLTLLTWSYGQQGLRSHSKHELIGLLVCGWCHYDPYKLILRQSFSLNPSCVACALDIQTWKWLLLPFWLFHPVLFRKEGSGNEGNCFRWFWVAITWQSSVMWSLSLGTCSEVSQLVRLKPEFELVLHRKTTWATINENHWDRWAQASKSTLAEVKQPVLSDAHVCQSVCVWMHMQWSGSR